MVSLFGVASMFMVLRVRWAVTKALENLALNDPDNYNGGGAKPKWKKGKGGKAWESDEWTW